MLGLAKNNAKILQASTSEIYMILKYIHKKKVITETSIQLDPGPVMTKEKDVPKPYFLITRENIIKNKNCKDI